jgi:hypothetical protein
LHEYYSNKAPISDCFKFIENNTAAAGQLKAEVLWVQMPKVD